MKSLEAEVHMTAGKHKYKNLAHYVLIQIQDFVLSAFHKTVLKERENHCQESSDSPVKEAN